MKIEEEMNKIFEKEKKKGKNILLFFSIVILIIICLLYQRFSFSSLFKNQQVPAGNIDIFELKCNDNCSCSSNNSSISKLDTDSSLKDLVISEGTLNFQKDVMNYNILLENSVDKITINAIKSNNKSTLYYIYNKKIYNLFQDIPIAVGENIVTVVAIAEAGNFTPYRIVVSRLDPNGSVVVSGNKDSNHHLADIQISNGNLFFKQSITNYRVMVGEEVDKITLIATKASEKSTVSYVYNGKNYEEFKEIEISLGNNLVTIVVTAEDGTSATYSVIVTKGSVLSDSDRLQWYSTSKLNLFSNPIYKGEAMIAPGSSHSYEFIVRNKVNQKVRYQFEFKEESEYSINMKYRLKRNGKYLIGDDTTWVSYEKLNVTGLEVDSNKADDYVLDWKWFDSENDSLIGKLQKEYTLRMTLSATSLD